MHRPSPTDFSIPIAGVGEFVFARRTLGDSLKIRGEYIRLRGEYGAEDAELSGYANVAATIMVLCVSAPEGWRDIEALDLTADESVLIRLLELFDALKEKEDSFRGPTAQTSTQ